MFKTNKGLIDHCVGGVLGGSSAALLENPIPLIVALSTAAIGLEVWQYFNEYDKHTNFKKDSAEDLIGEFSFGLLAFFVPITIPACIAWLIYSKMYRWN